MVKLRTTTVAFEWAKIRFNKPKLSIFGLIELRRSWGQWTVSVVRPVWSLTCPNNTILANANACTITYNKLGQITHLTLKIKHCELLVSNKYTVTVTVTLTVTASCTHREHMNRDFGNGGHWLSQVEVLYSMLGHDHGHWIFILATHLEGKWTTNASLSSQRTETTWTVTWLVSFLNTYFRPF